MDNLIISITEAYGGFYLSQRNQEISEYMNMETLKPAISLKILEGYGFDFPPGLESDDVQEEVAEENQKKITTHINKEREKLKIF